MKRPHRLAALAMLGAALLVGAALWIAARDLFATAQGTAADPAPWNFVVFLTDDQRWDLNWVMPRMLQKLASQGVDFQTAFVTQPFCCPSRASFLAGGVTPAHTGVLQFIGPNGGARHFYDDETLATALQRAGYRTALVGKYVNGYEELLPRIPPGWSFFLVDSGGTTAILGNSTPDEAGVGSTVGGLPDAMRRVHYHFQAARQFIQDNAASPFLVYIAVHTPHYPVYPDPEDQNLFADFVYRARGYGEADLSDKPAAVRNTATPFYDEVASSIQEEDEFHRNQMRGLQAVDREVEQTVSLLESLGVADRTVFFYTSDNGYMWGEHWQWSKTKPYEESIRVPLVVRMPGNAVGTRSGQVVSNLDIPATILDLAGVEHYTDGHSLVPMLLDPSEPGQPQVFISQPGSGWIGVRENRWKYVERRGGETELYDLQVDPFELASRHADPSLAALQSRLAAAATAAAPLSARHGSPLQNVRVGVPYDVSQFPWAGRPPYRWGIVQGEIPPGISLDPTTGRLNGIPVRAYTDEILIEVRDSSERPIRGGPQRWRLEWTPVVTFDGDDRDGIPAPQDRCPEAYDPLQRDADGDGRGDPCDDPCANGVDDDGDGLADLGDDPGCDDPSDASERTAVYECDDALDNDEDGLQDYGLDPGCGHPMQASESPACDNGVDDDGDGFVDLVDPQCLRASGDSEAQGSCGLGAELAPLLLLRIALRRRFASRKAGPSSSGASDSSAPRPQPPLSEIRIR